MKKLPLSKQLTFGAIVLGSSFAISFLLGLITARVPPEELTTPNWFIGLIFGVVAGTVYLMLANNRHMPLADNAARAAALAGPGAGEAQLLVYRQGFVGKMAGIDIWIDGAVATQLKSPRFAALTLTPGRHELFAEVQGKRTKPLPVELAPGEAMAVRVNMAIGRADLIVERDLAVVRRTLASVPMIAPPAVLPPIARVVA